MSKRVLIVDDEPNIVLSLEYLLKRAGHETAVAPDGEAALAALAERTPDLVVLDVMLPKLNGFELCERIRADPRWSGTKVLMLTARGRDTEVTRGLRLGADAYVTKPFSTKDLMARIDELLGVRR
ncbi:response regulator transcription factor [Anaeromyxobacter sp. Fw109-5]|uniref:response regulator transcription factor n=1 Tax=Anaeromyxobacter sp. (strain Fw109-5) TaxID=404589 RepID=UPI0000ED8BDA|nr:response regulator [Anaeromyxobacter sp. Fw109-5]ABS26232.1 response regulator receiver protein [Anaeromyxobacter sp. Fw109-5]